MFYPNILLDIKRRIIKHFSHNRMKHFSQNTLPLQPIFILGMSQPCSFNTAEKLYLVQVGQRVGVLAQSLVLPSQTVAGSYPPESTQVHYIQSTDMVSPTLKMIAPVTLLPKPEPIHLSTTVTEWCITIWSTTKIKVPEFFHICSHNLRTIYTL
jgi:hypothetical protein